MLRIRKVKTKSGSTAIQVVKYTGHSAKIVKHMGSAKAKFIKSVSKEKIELNTALIENYISSEGRCNQIARSDLLSGIDDRKIPGANNSNDLEKYKASGVEYYRITYT